MRNWNMADNGASLNIGSPFLQYLWGIETVSTRIPFWVGITVFTVPMRNWNLRWKVKKIKIKKCFYSTYEELKQSNNNFLKLSASCFYSTYEELKLKLSSLGLEAEIKFLQYLWGIETSSSFAISAPLHWVFTVPMRNWNYLNHQVLHCLI